MIRVQGPTRLEGRVMVSGSKNACLPVMAATLMTTGRTYLRGVPAIEDVRTMAALLRALGSSVESPAPGELIIDTPGTISSAQVPEALARRMRGSFLVLGPLLARCGEVRTARPGGDDIGLRRVDQHVQGLRAMGARVEQEGDLYTGSAGELRGAEILLDMPTVTGTENLMMAASLARGRTVIWNAAREPHVVDLARFLNSAGARIEGAGTEHVVVDGVEGLGGAEHTVASDYIEAGTYALFTATAGGEARIEGASPRDLVAVCAKLRATGVTVETGEDWMLVRAAGRLSPVDLTTWPHPGFPTDLQAPYVALMTQATGPSLVSEAVYENRFRHVRELERMGALTRLEGRSVYIDGPARLRGAAVTVPDIRSGAALVAAALAAHGETEIEGVAHLDRGYEDLSGKLAGLGARIERIGEPETALAVGYE